MATNPKPVAIAKPKHSPAGQAMPYLPAALARACANFEEAAGGRAALIEHLSHAQLDEKTEMLLGAIADPANDELDLARICQLYDIQFAGLLGLFKQAGFAKAQFAALQRIWDMVPDLAQDVMTRALPHDLPCRACGATGKVEEEFASKDDDGKLLVETREVACKGCRGRGQIRHEPDIDQQKLGLQLAGLIVGAGAAPAAIVNVNQKVGLGVQVNNRGGVDGALRAFREASDKILYPQVVEVEAEAEAEEANADGLEEQSGTEGAGRAHGEEAPGPDGSDPQAAAAESDADAPDDLPGLSEEELNREAEAILAREEQDVLRGRGRR